MHDKVKVHWAADMARRRRLGELAMCRLGGMTARQARRDVRMAELKQLVNVLTTTDMAVIVSLQAKRVNKCKAGAGHRGPPQAHERVEPGTDEKFKDTDDPLRLAFVCAMWLTGDAPSAPRSISTNPCATTR